MPAYSFKQQFCEYVKDGSKPHTIRSYRKHPVKLRAPLSLYYGMRTRRCTLLRKEACTAVKTIAITASGTVAILENPWLYPDEVEGLKMALLALDQLAVELDVNPYDNSLSIGRPCVVLLPEDKDRLAWLDGFRPVGSTLDAPANAFELMMAFWRDSHEFPFVGNIIYWEPK